MSVFGACGLGHVRVGFERAVERVVRYVLRGGFVGTAPSCVRGRLEEDAFALALNAHVLYNARYLVGGRKRAVEEAEVSVECIRKQRHACSTICSMW